MWRHRCYQKLLLFLIFLKEIGVNKHKLSHREELARINFTSNKISIKNRNSFICPCHLKNSLISCGRKLLRYSYPFISINMRFTGTMAKVYRALMEWFHWNHTSAWVLSCKFAAYFQNTFLKNTSGWLLLKAWEKAFISYIIWVAHELMPELKKFVEQEITNAYQLCNSS